MRGMVLGAWLLLTPLAVTGQTFEPRGFEGWAGYAAWAGADVESVDPGLQIGFVALAEAAPHVGFGVEGVYGFFEQLGVGVDEVGLNVVLRWALGSRRGVHGYVQGRTGWSRLAAESLSHDGFVVGPEVGLELPVSPTLRVIFAAGGTWRTYRNAASGVGLPLMGSSGSGFQYGARIGLAVGEIF